jgi:hypothetical protein
MDKAAKLLLGLLFAPTQGPDPASYTDRCQGVGDVKHLESNMSPTQYRNWRNQLQSNSDFFIKLLTKHPFVDEPFLTALYNGVVFQSEAQVVATQKLVKKLLEQNAVVFQPVKNSLVKAEPLGDERESTVQVSASFGTTRDRAPSSGSAEPEKGCRRGEG